MSSLIDVASATAIREYGKWVKSVNSTTVKRFANNDFQLGSNLARAPLKRRRNSSVAASLPTSESSLSPPNDPHWSRQKTLSLLFCLGIGTNKSEGNVTS